MARGSKHTTVAMAAAAEQVAGLRIGLAALQEGLSEADGRLTSNIDADLESLKQLESGFAEKIAVVSGRLDENEVAANKVVSQVCERGRLFRGLSRLQTPCFG